MAIRVIPACLQHPVPNQSTSPLALLMRLIWTIVITLAVILLLFAIALPVSLADEPGKPQAGARSATLLLYPNITTPNAERPASANSDIERQLGRIEEAVQGIRHAADLNNQELSAELERIGRSLEQAGATGTQSKELFQRSVDQFHAGIADLPKSFAIWGSVTIILVTINTVMLYLLFRSNFVKRAHLTGTLQAVEQKLQLVLEQTAQLATQAPGKEARHSLGALREADPAPRQPTPQPLETFPHPSRHEVTLLHLGQSPGGLADCPHERCKIVEIRDTVGRMQSGEPFELIPATDGAFCLSPADSPDERFFYPFAGISIAPTHRWEMELLNRLFHIAPIKTLEVLKVDRTARFAVLRVMGGNRYLLRQRGVLELTL